MLKIKNWQRLRCQFSKGCALYNIFLLHPIEAFPSQVSLVSFVCIRITGLLDNNYFPIDNVETFASLLHAHTIKIIDGID